MNRMIVADCTKALLQKERRYMEMLRRQLPAAATYPLSPQGGEGEEEWRGAGVGVERGEQASSCSISTSSSSTSPSSPLSPISLPPDQQTSDREGSSDGYDLDCRRYSQHHHLRTKTTSTMAMAAAELESVYANFHSSGKDRQFNDGSDIVKFLYQVVDYYKEDREIVQVALNYLDRYLLSLSSSSSSSSVAASKSHCRTIAASATTIEGKGVEISPSSLSDGTKDHNLVTVDGDSPGTVVQDAQEKCSKDSLDHNSDKGDDHELSHELGIVVLCCLDLAIKMTSPFSGDLNRALFTEIMDVHEEQQQQGQGTQAQAQAQGVTVYDILDERWNRLTKDERSAMLSSKYNRRYFESLRKLSNIYTAEHFATVQTTIINSLEYNLHPPTSSSFVMYFLSLLDDCSNCDVATDLYNPHEDKYNDNHNRKRKNQNDMNNNNINNGLFATEDKQFIGDYANMQIELAMFDISLAATKPSILAFCALQNAIIQYYYSLSLQNKHPHTTTGTNTDANGHSDSGSDSTSLAVKIVQGKLRVVNNIIGRNILNIDYDNHVKSKQQGAQEQMKMLNDVGKCLFKFWRLNNSDIVTVSDLTFDSCRASGTYRRSFTTMRFSPAADVATFSSPRNDDDDHHHHDHHDQFCTCNHDDNESIDSIVTATTAISSSTAITATSKTETKEEETTTVYNNSFNDVTDIVYTDNTAAAITTNHMNMSPCTSTSKGTIWSNVTNGQPLTDSKTTDKPDGSTTSPTDTGTRYVFTPQGLRSNSSEGKLTI